MLLALALVLELVFAWLLATGDLRHGALPGTLAALGLASLAHVLALVVVVRARPDPRALPLVLGAAVVFRATLLPLAPSLSEDAWRYVWEGRVQLAGFDPYLLHPDAYGLEALRDDAWVRVSHRHVPAVYGPLLEALFALLAALPGGLLPFKLAFVAADLGVAGLLVRLLRRRGLPPALALAWAWHPLVVLEVAGQAHLEAVPVFLLLLAVDLAETGRARLAALALGASIAAKYLPVLLVPVFVARAPRWREAATQAALVAVPGLVLVVPYLRGLAAPAATGVGAFAAAWRFNDGGFLALDTALRGLGVSPAVLRALDLPPDHLSWLQAPAKVAAGALAAALVARLALRRAPPARAAFAAGAAFLALSPVVHPWYALWVLPFLALRRRGAGPWLLLSLALPLSYVVVLRYDGADPATWVEEPWVRAVVYLPALAWLALEGCGFARPGTLGGPCEGPRRPRPCS